MCFVAYEKAFDKLEDSVLIVIIVQIDTDGKY